ncbi:hypothetical protein [Desulfosporosinus sp. Sb-LF]|uniref:hypothetical protein n=1 Tax=Desulfosporosinus sp. Sb-LF TaxID=2560027 RepID=UPI00107F66D6|nr:hypothetical protein [Desulfosporosinus sp. Sb-LF]TGE33589.1 hypothetical protein E4K68_05435 [Desulfosporosinus sp. Sb-LF]
MINRLNRLTFASYKTFLLLGFMGLNFLLTGVDVLMAHSQNDFFRWELIPLIYSPLAVLAIIAQLVFKPNDAVKRMFQTVMWIGVIVGVAGTFFHLTGNATSSRESLHHLLIEGSPIAAPIAFAGISSYALASQHYQGTARRSKLLILVGLGFLGAVVAAFLDHARLGFEPIYTLIPLVTGTLATVSCFYMAYGQGNQTETYIYLSILTLNMLVGLLGFGFHVLGDLAGTQTIILARFLYRNPLLGPLLFCNLALLGALSLLPESAMTFDKVRNARRMNF